MTEKETEELINVPPKRMFAEKYESFEEFKENVTGKPANESKIGAALRFGRELGGSVGELGRYQGAKPPVVGKKEAIAGYKQEVKLQKAAAAARASRAREAKFVAKARAVNPLIRGSVNPVFRQQHSLILLKPGSVNPVDTPIFYKFGLAAQKEMVGHVNPAQRILELQRQQGIGVKAGFKKR